MAYIVVLVLALGGGNLIWTSVSINRAQAAAAQAVRTAQASQRRAIAVAIASAVASSDHQWCDSLDVLTSGQKPSKSQPGIIRLDSDFQALERKFRC